MVKYNLAKNMKEIQIALKNQDELILELIKEEKESKLEELKKETILLYKEFAKVENPFLKKNLLIFLDDTIGDCLKKIDKDYVENIEELTKLYQGEKEIMNL